MTMPSFDLRVVRTATARCASCPRGELDIATAPQLEQAIAEATTDAGAELVLDLRELTFMDSTGLRDARAGQRCRPSRRGTTLSIWRGSRQIERVLEISGLGALLPLADAPAD